MIAFDLAIVGVPTVNYIIANNIVSGYVSTAIIWSGTVATGYNIVNFPVPIAASKGSLLYMYISDGAIGINTASTAPYQDYTWSTDTFLAAGQNLYAKVITQSTSGSSQTTKINSFTHLYSSPGTYSLYANFSCNSVGYSDTKTIGGKLKTQLIAY